MSPALVSAFVEATRVRSRSVRRLGIVACAYITAFGAAVLAWLAVNGVAPTVWLIGPGLLMPAIALVLLMRSTADARRYTMHMLAATLALPAALLFWADSFELGMPNASPAAAEPALDAQRLFNGAVAIQDSDLRNSQGPLLRAASFADGSELRLTRYADPHAAAAYLAMLESTFRGEPFTDEGRRAIRLQNVGTGSTLVIVEQHGADLLELRSRDKASGLARLAAQQVPVPGNVPLAGPASPVTAASALPQWPFYVGATTAHMLFFVGLIFWGGSALTQVPALAGSVAVAPQALSDRLSSLARANDRLNVSMPSAGSLLFEVRLARKRSHRITLRLDSQNNAVQVGEKLAADGAAPLDEDEASMGDFGESAFDATRPDAQRVWSSTWQATMIEPARLANVPLQLQSAGALLPAAYLDSLDGEGVLTVLCAVVTRSGWHWQPRLGCAQ
jgi:hypothetical protein